VRQFRNFSVILGLATSCAVTWALTAGTEVASAATRLRSGRVQLVATTHATANAGAAGGFSLTGSDVMASVVGLMMLTAMVFLVITFVRRRVSVA
jgi:hypothetical protein